MGAMEEEEDEDDRDQAMQDIVAEARIRYGISYGNDTDPFERVISVFKAREKNFKALEDLLHEEQEEPRVNNFENYGLGQSGVLTKAKALLDNCEMEDAEECTSEDSEDITQERRKFMYEVKTCDMARRVQKEAHRKQINEDAAIQLAAIKERQASLEREIELKQAKKLEEISREGDKALRLIEEESKAEQKNLLEAYKAPRGGNNYQGFTKAIQEAITSCKPVTNILQVHDCKKDIILGRRATSCMELALASCMPERPCKAQLCSIVNNCIKNIESFSLNSLVYLLPSSFSRILENIHRVLVLEINKGYDFVRKFYDGNHQALHVVNRGLEGLVQRRASRLIGKVLKLSVTMVSNGWLGFAHEWKDLARQAKRIGAELAVVHYTKWERVHMIKHNQEVNNQGDNEVKNCLNKEDYDNGSKVNEVSEEAEVVESYHEGGFSQEVKIEVRDNCEIVPGDNEVESCLNEDYEVNDVKSYCEDEESYCEEQVRSEGSYYDEQVKYEASYEDIEKEQTLMNRTDTIEIYNTKITKIQALARGYISRKIYKVLHEERRIIRSVCTIQALWRRLSVRRMKLVQEMKRQKRAQERVVTKIQAFWRGFIMRLRFKRALERVKYVDEDEFDYEALDCILFTVQDTSTYDQDEAALITFPEPVLSSTLTEIKENPESQIIASDEGSTSLESPCEDNKLGEGLDVCNNGDMEHERKDYISTLARNWSFKNEEAIMQFDNGVEDNKVHESFDAPGSNNVVNTERKRKDHMSEIAKDWGFKSEKTVKQFMKACSKKRPKDDGSNLPLQDLHKRRMKR